MWCSPQDVDHLRRLGKRHLYVLKLDQDHVHEDDAAQSLAMALAGPGVGFDAQAKEGQNQSNRQLRRALEG